jgi:hypothetical protein
VFVLEIRTLDPLSDSRWDELVHRHPAASIFHERGWLEPMVLTNARPGESLENGIAICRVSSWMTGTRLVSLPFSDHCEPLLSGASELRGFTDWLQAECDRQQCRYVELRPLLATNASDYGLQPSCSYWFHELDLRPSLDQIFLRLHVNSFRRKVQRAEREGLCYESGQSELLDDFYRLLLITRKRHHLLPQPRAWFRNLLECMGDKLQIRLVRKNRIPVAAMLTLRHRSSVVYKYGCSNERFHRLGGMPLLFWRLVEESKASGAERIDFGRTDVRNQGLIAFKERLGTSRKLLMYFRYSIATSSGVAKIGDSDTARRFLSRLPEAVFSAAGRVLYRHMG